MKTICVDACFLIAIFDETEEYHMQAKNYFIQAFDKTPNRLLIPWPILYETISTQMVKNQKRMDYLKKYWEMLYSRGKLVLIDDLPYRIDAVYECLEEVKKERRHYRSLSLTDRVIRKILSEVDLKIDAFITFDQGHFVDICKRYKRQMITQGNM